MKKLYYVPGLISILGLPVLLFFFGPEDFAYEYCCSIFLPHDKRDPEKEFDYSKEYVYEIISDKKIVTIDLDDGRDDVSYSPDPRINYMYQRKFAFITQSIEALQFTNDTSTVLRINLGESNTYGDFIWVLDNVVLYNLRRYTFMDNSFYLWANNPIDHSPQIRFPPMPVSYNGPGSSKWEIFKKDFRWEFRKLYNLIKRNYGYFLGFILLIVVPGIIGIRKSKISM